MARALLSAASALLLSAAAVGLARADDCAQIDVSDAVLTASHDNSVNANEDYHRAFDSDQTTKWLVYEGVEESVWVQVVLPEAHALTKYGITSANDAPERDPSSWSVAASNDGVYFVTLDEQVGATWDTREQRQVFSVANSAEFSYFRFEFHSVRDAATANSFQINYISLYEGDCEDACCGVDCGDHGTCSDGECVCDLGFDGSSCGDVTNDWAVYVGRAVSGMDVSAVTTTTAADLAACQALCVDGNADAACIGVNFVASSGVCEVVAGATAASTGWQLAAAAAGTDATAALLVSVNLQPDANAAPAKTVMEQVEYTVAWDPTNRQMPRVDMYIGESVTFAWEDVNVRNLPQHSAPNHHDVYLFAGEAQYQRCDFRNAQVVAVAPTGEANKQVTWTSVAEGKYYFGSKYGTDCSAGQLKMIVQVARRPSP